MNQYKSSKPCIWKKNGLLDWTLDVDFFVVVAGNHDTTTFLCCKRETLGFFNMRSSRWEKELPLLAASGFKLSCKLCEVPQPNHWCVMAHDWTADVSPAGHCVSAPFIWSPRTCPLLCVDVSSLALKEVDGKVEEGAGGGGGGGGEEEEEEEEEESWATSPNRPGFCTGGVVVISAQISPPPHPPTLCSLNGWGSLGLCSSAAQAMKVGSNLWIDPSVWRLEGNAQKCASLQLNSEDFFSPALSAQCVCVCVRVCVCVCYFFFSSSAQSLQQTGKVSAEVAALTLQPSLWTGCIYSCAFHSLNYFWNIFSLQKLMVGCLAYFSFLFTAVLLLIQREAPNVVE